MPTDLSVIVPRTSPTIDNLFRFQINSSVQCLICKQKSSATSPYFLWNIPIDGYQSLPHALNGFCQSEDMTGDNAYQCENCSKKVHASKRLSISNVSPYLILTLKRFKHVGLRQSNIRKLSHFVAYPKILDISPYLSENISNISNEDDVRFNSKLHLYAVIVHIGEQVNNGHLYSYIRGPNDRWYCANDSIITRITIDQVLSSKDAYILFYAEDTSASFESRSLNINSLPSSSLIVNSQAIDHRAGTLFSLDNQQSLVTSRFFFPKLFLIPASLCFRQIHQKCQLNMIPSINVLIYLTQMTRNKFPVHTKVKL